MLDTLGSTAYALVCRSELIRDASLLARYEALLNERERGHLRNFRFTCDAHDFLIAHALVRTALSHFCDVQPAQWHFRINKFGRPEVAGPLGFDAIRFNLSHCDGLVACIVAAGSDVGIDVEKLRILDDLDSMVKSFCSVSEAVGFHQLPRDIATTRFFTLWTLKEAYVKARGLGLSLPFHKFSFKFDESRLSVRFDSDMHEHEQDWTFSATQPLTSYILATAIRCDERGVHQEVAMRWFTPLIGMQGAVPACTIASSTTTPG